MGAVASCGVFSAADPESEMVYASGYIDNRAARSTKRMNTGVVGECMLG